MIVDELKRTGRFKQIGLKGEENEHSLELHFPFIAYFLTNPRLKLVPIIVGNLTQKDVDYYSKALKKYFDDPKTVFCVSTDFCHWGSSFSYNYWDKENFKYPYEYIEDMDKTGCSIIEKMDPKGWISYIKKTKNTICGKNSVWLLLQLLETKNNEKETQKITTKLCGYSQSSKAKSNTDSSVSYASFISYV